MAHTDTSYTRTVGVAARGCQEDLPEVPNRQNVVAGQTHASGQENEMNPQGAHVRLHQGIVQGILSVVRPRRREIEKSLSKMNVDSLGLSYYQGPVGPVLVH